IRGAASPVRDAYYAARGHRLMVAGVRARPGGAGRVPPGRQGDEQAGRAGAGVGDGRLQLALEPADGGPDGPDRKREPAPPGTGQVPDGPDPALPAGSVLRPGRGAIAGPQSGGAAAVPADGVPAGGCRPYLPQGVAAAKAFQIANVKLQ